MKKIVNDCLDLCLLSFPCCTWWISYSLASILSWYLVVSLSLWGSLFRWFLPSTRGSFRGCVPLSLHHELGRGGSSGGFLFHHDLELAEALVDLFHLELKDDLMDSVPLRILRGGASGILKFTFQQRRHLLDPRQLVPWKLWRRWRELYTFLSRSSKK